MKGHPRRKQPSEELTLIDAVCGRFEDACKAAGTHGSMPCPESFLDQAPDGQKRALLVELSKRELEYRLRRLKSVTRLKKLSERLSPLKIVELIGKGGMGRVYKAQDDQGNFVAVKILPKAFGEDAELRLRFEKEAEVLDRVQHENIVALRPIPNLGESKLGLSWRGRDGLAYYVMDFVEGGSLRSRMKENGIAAIEATDIICQICNGLRHAHASKFIHRDIKPENILIDGKGRIKIADFGLAKVVDSDQTKSGQIMGTLAYMAPEQHRGAKKVDHRADIYSVGIVFYELLTGRKPDTEDLLIGLGHIEPGLREVVVRALAQNPDDRFQTIDDMMEALQAGTSQAPADVSGGTCNHVKTDTNPFAVGTVVECRWKGGQRYYKGRITEVDGDRFHVRYDDGDKEWTTSELMRLFADLAVGTLVQCRWKGRERYFPGKITDLDGERIHIDYDDGDEEWTTAELIKKLD